MNAYQRVLAARSNQRPDAMRYINFMISDFVELHGDRRFADDAAMVAGLGYFGNRCVTVLGLEKGVDTPDRLKRNFGSAQPEGYRKSLWHLRQAEKFSRPVLCFIDTAGAACGVGAEERGQGQAIAENLWEMMGLKVPVLSVIIGEGGSGGALALAAANRVWMLENAVYSVLSPEGAASIIYKDAGKVLQASEALKMSAQDMLSFGVIEGILPEGKDFELALPAVRDAFDEALKSFERLTGEDIRRQRYERFRGLGGDWT
ncbi:MAG: carboxyltransferase subunit alpha [Eubacteriales bacterium]|jgi:acetyl-CoA carboxylase carboxyl transferase subunit alpha|nr:carboxyltransferase subunit alpha [Eubacteriales bacterium]MDD4134351.1 carboxyltransferase subunit alpha [Eubacteriales bacterium]